MPGAVLLLAGEPGVGKSTLLLETAASWARTGGRALFVTGEESAAQVRMRAERIDAVADELFLAAETDLGVVLGHVDATMPTLLGGGEVRALAAELGLRPTKRRGQNFVTDPNTVRRIVRAARRMPSREDWPVP